MKKQVGGYVYILASKRNGTLYIGVTNDISRRIYEHKNGIACQFTKKNGVKMLVYYEEHEMIEEAIKREKDIKECQRKWKLNLIEEFNPNWEDLYDTLA